jgi:protein-S-isoprenylcysteine O-methyltransferase Ste14
MVLSTFIMFARLSLKSSNKNIQMKGKLLLIGGVLITSGIVFDTAVPMSLLILALTRIIFILGAIFFYFGFFYKGKSNETELKT